VCRHDAGLAIRTTGITLTVYSEGDNIDREWPFDIIPRTIFKSEWDQIEPGLKQRQEVLNHFINDVYNDQKILKDKVVPRDIIATSKDFRPECVGMTPQFGLWALVKGSLIVNSSQGVAAKIPGRISGMATWSQLS